MPEWLTIAIAVFGLIGTIFGILGFSSYISERMKHKADKKNKQEDKAEEEAESMMHESYVAELKGIIDSSLTTALAPITSDLNLMKSDVCLMKDGLQKDLYVDLVMIYKDLCKKGYATLEEKRDYNNLYLSYHRLGQNGIADGMHKHVMEMDEEPKKRAPRKAPAKKKQTLVE